MDPRPEKKGTSVLLRRSLSTTTIAFASFALTPFFFVACAEGTTRPGIGNGEGGEGADWGGPSSSSSASSGMGGNGTGGASSSSSSTSSGGGGNTQSFVLLRVGDGSVALSGNAAPVYIEHLQTDGSPTPKKTTLALPTVVSGNNWPLTLSGTATAEGNLSLSANGKYVFVAGYQADVGTPSVNTTATTEYTRIVGRIDAFDNVDTSTSLGTAFNSSSVRGATSPDGLSIWVSGNGATTGGVHFTTLGAFDATQILSAPNNVRFVHVFGNQLYGTSGAGTFVNVFTVGSGLPTSPGQMGTPLQGMSTAAGPSPYSFALVDRSGSISGLDTMYVADERSLANFGGIQRWVYDGFSWTNDLTFGDGTSGVRGLAAAVEGAGVRIIATTAEAPTNRILSIYDDPYAQPAVSPKIVAIAISPMNTAYRGVAFAPQVTPP